MIKACSTCKYDQHLKYLLKKRQREIRSTHVETQNRLFQDIKSFGKFKSWKTWTVIYISSYTAKFKERKQNYEELEAKKKKTLECNSKATSSSILSEIK